MKTAICSTFALCVVVAFVGCAGTKSSNDDSGAAGAPADGPGCATDADCSESLPKCTLAGVCRTELECDLDADCPGDFKHCDTYHTCWECVVDADCPSDRPACAANYEIGMHCAECHRGDSSLCPTGTWCALGFGDGGECEPANCAALPLESACAACVTENADACVGDGDECAAPLAALQACYDADPGAPTCNRLYPSADGCTPSTCVDEAEAFDACLLACESVAVNCE
jgi:hypothetical protein